MKKCALVLEGGGLRGVYTAGVLDYFMEKGIYFEYVIGVSMGACLGASYVSRQRGRNEKITIGLVSDKRYFSFRNMLRTGNLFGVEFVYEEVPKRLIPFDYVSFLNSPTTFYMVSFDCESGEAFYMEKNQLKDINAGFRATSALPLLSTCVEIEGRRYLDGGIIDPIPFQKPLDDGKERLIVVRTRPDTYRKSKEKFMSFMKLKYGKYPHLISKMEKRHELYNEQIERLEVLQEQGTAFVIQPSVDLNVSRLEKDQKKLKELFQQGYEDAKNIKKELFSFINRE